MQVVQKNCRLGQEGGRSIGAHRILRAQKFKLPDRIQQSLVPTEDASLFRQQAGDHVRRLWRLRVRGIAVIHAAIRVQHMLVLVSCAR